MIKLKIFLKLEDWTRECCKILGWIVIRGERLIKLRDSWFSTKSIEVEWSFFSFKGKVILIKNLNVFYIENLRIVRLNGLNRLWARRFIVKRETAQIIS